MNSRNIFLSTFLVLSSCSSLWGENLHPVDEKKPAESVTRQSSRSRAYFGQMQWAVQNYEAGEYKKAVGQFEKLSGFGTEVPNYELIPFYMGMSFYRMNQLAPAIENLRQFLVQMSAHHHAQEARMTLLSIFEQQKQWDALLGMAAETDKLTLFQNNRAFLKLVWARALIAKGEKKGADLLLKESLQYLDSGDYRVGKGTGPESDLWGRYYYTSQLLKNAECGGLDPKTIGQGKSQKRLYQPWLESQSDCFRSLFEELVNNLLKQESSWTNPTIQLAQESFAEFTQKIRRYQGLEKSKIETSRNLSAQARQNLYRLLGKVDEMRAQLQNSQLESTPLQKLRAQIDEAIAKVAANELP